ncbi:putative quinol monooxygenase [Egicoccus halophilus]|uniref:Antibiotic biosynthesis monooxygenase n=1 Tax=Egicoccus halophilus TaxID=1670830 RepID=A0A8J3AF53_9ACTN|nr:putative quinol monooxygenase [Egicoccus halophilus]GGI06983.1 antibiotic biosynthesis monooxygenase [Egicoccus halophilus]
MYGLHGRIDATEGHGEELAGHLVAGTQELGDHGCLLYVVSRREDAPDAVYVYEVWTDADAHQASLELSSVQDAIAGARPLIAGMSERVEFTPVAGLGLPAAGSPPP